MRRMSRLDATPLLLFLRGSAIIAILLAAGCSASKGGGGNTGGQQQTPSLGVTKTHQGNLTQGQQGATYSVTVSNAVGAAASSGTVTVTETVPSGLTLQSMAGTGWTCSANTCSRSDSLAAGSSYPAITVAVNVAANATSPQVNSVSVSGGGSANATATDSTAISIAPSLAISMTHLGNFSQGQLGATYSLTISNAANAIATSGTVTVTDALPSELTMVSMAGTGWTCVLNVCTRNDALAGGSSYPAITVTVIVAANATSPQINAASVSGGNSATANASDPTTIAAPLLSISKAHQGSLLQGQQNAVYTVTVSNGSSAGATSGAVTVTETVPSGLALVSMAGTGWDCTVAPTCTRSDSLASGSTYAPITVTVNVANNASSPQVNAVAVSGGNSAPANTTDSAFINLSDPCAGGPSGGEPAINGHYAFVAQGFQGNGNGMSVVIGASFTANGAATNNVTGGELDINTSTGPQHFTINGTGSSYVLGPDPATAGEAGCMTLALANGQNLSFRFALGSLSGGIASEGRIIEYDDPTGTGTHLTGVLRQQDTAAFATADTSKLHANYAFGINGVDTAQGPFAVAGSLVLSPATGTIINSNLDLDDAGTVRNNVAGSTGSITSVSATTGRAIFTFTPSGASQTDNVIYIVNADEFFIVSADSFSTMNMYSGRAVVSASSFNTAALNGNFIVHLTGTTSCSTPNPNTPCADVNLGLLTLTPTNSTTGTLTGTLFEYDRENHARTKTILLTDGATYTVDGSTGRVTLANVGNNPPVFYLTSPASDTESIFAFIDGQDTDVSFGFAENGASAPVVTSFLAGNYFFGNENPGSSGVGDQIGVVTIDSSGTLNGTEWDSGQTGLQINAISAVNGAGPVVIDNVNGPGTGNVGASTVAITNGAKLFFVDESGGAARITIVERQ